MEKKWIKVRICVEAQVIKVRIHRDSQSSKRLTGWSGSYKEQDWKTGKEALDGHVGVGLV